jgi:predicted O-methyltransferase YrrM
MSLEHRSPDWDSYKMDYHNPFAEVEAPAQEVAAVDAALRVLRDCGIIPSLDYDGDRLLAHRKAVAELFEIPWTAITPRVQRLLYAINATVRPRVMIAAGVFCGNTFISNAGAAVGPGACYTAQDLVGLEIKPEEAERAERNVRRLDPTGVARILAEDAVPFARDYPDQINLLYLDADGSGGRGKGIYLEILECAWDRMPPGSVVLAHNSVNCADRLQDYFAYVRNPENCRASVNVIIDGEGLEVSAR